MMPWAGQLPVLLEHCKRALQAISCVIILQHHGPNLVIIINMTQTKNTNTALDAQDIQQSFHHTGGAVNTDSKALQLTGHLQGTLELSTILELFHDAASALVPHDGLFYTNQDENDAINFGEATLHRCRYQLALLDKPVGEMVFHRQTKFTDEEIKQIEPLIGALIHPLHNALLYNEAIKTAHRDPVTGVGNRAAMNNVLQQEIDLTARYDATLSAMMLDIDKFKHINDTYGHIAGDTVLKHVADIMVECMRRSDIVYRFGGEEFVILLRNTQTEGAKLLAERVRQSVESAHFNYGDHQIQATISVGISSVQKDDTEKSLLDRCDQALYKAKENGRNCVVIAAT